MKNIVIVGSSSGVGKSVAELYRGSTDVEIFSYSRTEGEGIWRQWEHSQALPVEHLPEVIDGVVYCPGTVTLKPFGQLKEEDFLHDYQVNFLGLTRVLKALHPRLKKSSQASVVCFSTVAVSRGMSFHSSIAGAKGAVEGLVKSLAIEWAPAIRVNAIAPSLVETPLTQKLTANSKVREASEEKHPLKRLGQPQDIAEMVCFLLSNKSSWMTGQVLHVDGGMSV